MKIDWKRKLTSRKFWIAVTGEIGGIITTITSGGNPAQVISGVILQVASVVAYIIGEGLTDKAGIESEKKEDEDK